MGGENPAVNGLYILSIFKEPKAFWHGNAVPEELLV
jgi:hypothetical protein